MQINRFLCTAAICFAVVLTACSSIKNKEWDEDSVLDESYSAFIKQADDYLIKKDFHGSVLVSKGQDIIFAKGYGLCNKADASGGHNSIHTTFEIGSLTKQMTAAAIVQLQRAGKLSFDDKISKYFPGYVHGDEITVGMLLSMRSGLYDHINMPYDFFPTDVAVWLDKAALEGRNEDVGKDFVLGYLYDAPLMTAPDSTHFYCNTDYYLLGLIIEQVSGLGYEEYLQREIFDRCGMIDSNVDFQSTTAKGYDFKGRYFSILGGLGLGCGDVNSTVLDLFKWNYALAHGKVIPRRVFKKMMKNQSYVLGLYHDEFSFLHGGATNVFNSFSQYFVDDEVSIIVLCNEPVGVCSATIVAGNLRKLLGLR